MPEASAAGRNRWYRVKWPDQRNLSPAWAEKYFDNHTEAFDYFERRRAEHPTGRVHRPVQSHEKPTVDAALTRYDRRDGLFGRAAAPFGWTREIERWATPAQS